MILYLHGFRSSPDSFKARMLAERIAATGNPQVGDPVEFRCPQLPASPRAAFELASRAAAACQPERLVLIGSSLGGFYATRLAEQIGCRAVLLNPAVQPWRELGNHVGVTTAFHSDAPFEFKPEYVGELKALAVPAITRPERYFLVAATGDELLDWREMVAHYPGARQLVIEGSDHGLSDFSDHIGAVLEFCGVPAAAGRGA